MATKKKQPAEFKNPFSEEFMVAWEFWKKFKKEQFYFSYKPIGEQAAIDDLFEISGGNEQEAKLIIKNAIVKGWRGLFPIKHNTNGQQPATNEQNRKDVTDILGSRTYEGR